MYHGGTNFGRTAGGPFITTSYDYDAPLDEYGELQGICLETFSVLSMIYKCPYQYYHLLLLLFLYTMSIFAAFQALRVDLF
jgi:hypothetical protein